MTLAAAGTALAHASLVRADPAEGAVLDVAPSRISLTFSEPVSPLLVALVRPDGARIGLSGAKARGWTLDFAAPPDLGNGTHAIVWRVISDDGHPVSGTVLFSLGAPGTPPDVAEVADWTARSGLLVGRVLLYCGLFLGVGGVFGSVWLRQTVVGAPRPIFLLVAAGLLGAHVSVGFQGLDTLGAPVNFLATATAWNAGFATSFGRTALIAEAALLLSLLCLVLPLRAARLLSLVAVLVAGTSLAASGHASAAEPRWLMRTAVFVHAVTIALWTGALFPLAWTLRQGGPDAVVALRRFSRSVPPAVAALVAAGTVLAVVQVETPVALAETAYGRVLLVKLALLVLLFGIAASNRWRLTSRTLRGEGGARRLMLRSIAAETAIVLLVFAVAACWRFTPPPRVLAIAAAEPAEVHIHTLEGMASVVVAPGHAGSVTAHITIMTGEYGPLDAEAVTLTMGNRAAGVAPFERSAVKPGDGTWRVENLELSAPGIWQVQVNVRQRGSAPLSLAAEIVIRP